MLYSDWYWNKRSTWVNSVLINSMRLLIDECFPSIMAHAEDKEARFSISVRDLIERYERVARFLSWEIYVRTYMSSGGIEFFAY